MNFITTRFKKKYKYNLKGEKQCWVEDSGQIDTKIVRRFGVVK